VKKISSLIASGQLWASPRAPNSILARWANPPLCFGNAVLSQDDFDNRRVPAGNVEKDKTVASMQRMTDIMSQYKAQLCIKHDKAQADTLKPVPEY
jgi:hypothetical protein